MPTQPAILAFAGSVREASLNRRLIRVAAGAAEEAGARVTLIELRDYPMPIYDGDLERREGLPEAARRFKRLLVEHDGVLIASPEYNSSIPPLVKNAIDWASRPEGDEPRLVAFQGKVAGLTAASPGALGGLRALSDLRAILQNIGVHVLPAMAAVPSAGDAFTDDGDLRDEARRKSVRAVGETLARTIRMLR